MRVGCSTLARAALAAVVLVAVRALAQTPLDEQGRGRLRDRARAPQAGQKLDDSLRKFNGDDPEERLEGVQGLAESPNEQKAIDALLAGTGDQDMRIRIKAIDVLGQMKAKDATPLLVQKLFLRDTDIPTKQRILATLGKIGDDRATQPILDFLDRNVDPAVRGNAIFALGDIGDRTALPRLEAIGNDGSDASLRRCATEAIRKIRDKPQPDVVVPALAVDKRGAGARPTP